MAAHIGRYEFTRADMGLRERAVKGLKSRAVSALFTEHFVTIFNKTCNNQI